MQMLKYTYEHQFLIALDFADVHMSNTQPTCLQYYNCCHCNVVSNQYCRPVMNVLL